VKYDPQNKIGYDIRGTVWVQFNQPAKAMENYDQCIAINPADHRSYNNRGTIYLNYFQKPNEALAEFNKAIEINPLGNYLLNRAICYYRLGNLNQARNDANAAAAKGATIPQALKTALQMN
jgi:tetratricopeptide (TPR) repeat protein